ncbi:hypothetical protein NMG60_11030916 [Bertholletia excelsa]
MACRTAAFRATTLLAEPWGPFPCNSNSVFSRPFFTCKSRSSLPCLRCDCRIDRARGIRFSRRKLHRLDCSHNETTSSAEDPDQGPPQEAVLKAISEVSKAEGRVGQTTNVVIGGTVTDDSTNEWLALDKKVNSYPTVRGFTAIGTGGDDFVQAMVIAVESVLQQPIPEGRVKHKLSSRGKYVSVNIGPVQVTSSEQVQAVYNAMRRDDRMKYFL